MSALLTPRRPKLRRTARPGGQAALFGAGSAPAAAPPRAAASAPAVAPPRSAAVSVAEPAAEPVAAGAVVVAEPAAEPVAAGAVVVAEPAAVAAPAAAPTASAHRHGPTLDDLVAGAWEGLVAGAPAACVVCGAPMAPRHSAGAGVVGGRCGGCGTTVS
jgi:hypothetical protein